jgi:predicted dehydrogenase
VGIVGCGLIGRKRAAALDGDQLVGCFDLEQSLAASLAEEFGGRVCASDDELFGLEPDVAIVAVPHDRLAEIGCRALAAGAHLLVEKPAGIGVADIDRISAAAQSAGRRVRVGFNHRFHPGIALALEEAVSGRFGEVMFVRALYGHGGRLGYEREWRMDADVSGGGELVDQGMHLLDLFHALIGPQPVRSALLRRHFWEAEVEDNAVVVVGDDAQDGPWGMFHVSWTEWKNMFQLEVYCRTGKLRVDGLGGSYGTERLTVYDMKPELGPPDIETREFAGEDVSWAREWGWFRGQLVEAGGYQAEDLASARYAWECVEAAYA